MTFSFSFSGVSFRASDGEFLDYEFLGSDILQSHRWTPAFLNFQSRPAVCRQRVLPLRVKPIPDCTVSHTRKQ